MFNCESFDNIIDYPPNEFCRLALIIPVPSSGYFWELFSLGQALVGPRSATTWCDIRMGMNRVTIRLAPIGSDWVGTRQEVVTIVQAKVQFSSRSNREIRVPQLELTGCLNFKPVAVV